MLAGIAVPEWDILGGKASETNQLVALYRFDSAARHRDRDTSFIMLFSHNRKWDVG